jgi:nucleotide-binding universal stress UspA family protein
VEVLTVLKPLLGPGLQGFEGIPGDYGALEDARVAALREAVRDRLREVGEGAERWPMRVEVGAPAAIIARSAGERAGGLILLGGAPDGAADRWPHGGTSLQVVHLASVPVLVVPSTATGLPGRAVAAVDFSEFSLNAAHRVAEILDEGGTVHLAHVAWTIPESPLLELVAEWNRTYNRGAEARMAELGRELESAARVRVETHVLAGEPVPELLELADRLHADVIAAGSHGYGFCGRVFIGSVSAKLLRAARCCVFLAPPAERPDVAGAEKVAGRGEISVPEAAGTL